MLSFYTLLNVHDYPDAKTDLNDYLQPHLVRVVDHYSKCFTLDGEEVTVITDAAEAMDTFQPGVSGAAGLAGYLWSHFRGASKTKTVHVRSGSTPIDRLDNPYYFPDFDDEKEETIEKDVNLSVGDICSKILQNESLCDQYPAWVPVLTVYLVLTISSAECERVVSVLKLIKTAKRNRMGQHLLEQLMHLKLNGPTLTVFCQNELDDDGKEINFSNNIDRALKVFFSDKERKVAVPEAWTQDFKSTGRRVEPGETSDASGDCALRGQRIRAHPHRVRPDWLQECEQGEDGKRQEATHD
jgi:hypothetical protein